MSTKTEPRTFLKRGEYHERLVDELLRQAERNFLSGDFSLFISPQLKLPLNSLYSLVGIVLEAGWELGQTDLAYVGTDEENTICYGRIFFQEL